MTLENDDPFAEFTGATSKKQVEDDPFSEFTVKPQGPAISVRETPYSAFAPAPMEMGQLGGVTPSFIPRPGEAPVLNPLPEKPPVAAPVIPQVDNSSFGQDFDAGVLQAKAGFAGLGIGANIAQDQIASEDLKRFIDLRDEALSQGLNGKAMQFQKQIDRLTARQEYLATDFLQSAQDAAAAQEKLKAIPTNPAAQQFMKEGQDLSTLWDLFKSDPWGVARTVTVRSLPASAPSLVGTIGGGIVAGPAGAFAAAGLGSGATEFGSSIIEQMQELGADPNDPEQYRAIFEANKEQIFNKAMLRAGIIGTFDAAGGAASRMLGSAALKSLPLGVASETGVDLLKVPLNDLTRKGLKVGGAIGLDAASGMAGEAGAQLATEGEVNKLGEVLAEGLGSVVMGPAELIGADEGKAGAANNGETPATGAPSAPVVGNLFGINQNPADPFAEFVQPSAQFTSDPFAEFVQPTTASATAAPVSGEVTNTVTPPASEEATNAVTPSNSAPSLGGGPESPAPAGNAAPAAAPASPAQPAGTPPAVPPLSPQGATPTEPQQPAAPAKGVRIQGEVGSIIDEAADRVGVPREALQRTAYLESRGNPNAKNPNSTAGGLFQFIDGTWKQYAPGQNKFDARASADAGARLWKDNKASLQKALGREPTDAEVYLAHQQGAGGAAKLLKNPNAMAVDVLGAKAVEGNGGKKALGMTAGQFAQMWIDKYNGVPSGEYAGGSTGSGSGAYTTPGLRSDEVGTETPSSQQPTAPNIGVSVPDQNFEQQRQTFAAAPKVESASLPTNTVSTDAGPIQTKPMVVDLASILSSDKPGYDPNLQPRDRSRVASQAQINEIAGNLDPNKLIPSPDADRGAPIINDAGMVESGNGRVMAIRQAYERNMPGAQAYRAQLQKMGFNTQGMSMPVLVQQRTTPLTPQQVQQYVHGANKPKALAMSATEQAAADAKSITPEMLSTMRDRTNPAANPDFVREFMKGLTTEERGALVGSDGRLNQAGVARVRNAVFAAAYGNSEVLSRVAESTDDNVRGLSTALMDAAPAMTKLRQGVEAGNVPADLDIRQDLVEAVNRLSEMRDKGLKLSAYLAQQDAFNPISPRVEELMRTFYNESGNRQRSKEVIGDFLRFYAEEAAKVSAEPSLMGLEPLSRGEVTETAKRKANIDGGGNQTGLFDAGQGDVSGVQGGSGEGTSPGRAEARRQEPDQAGAGQSRQREDNRSGRSETRRPSNEREDNREAGQNADRAKPRDRQSDRNEQAPVAVKGESQRAVYTNRASYFEDVFADNGVDPVEANNWPIEKQFAFAAKAIKDKFGLAHVDKTPKTVSRFAVDQLKDAYRNLQFMAATLQISNLAIGLDQHFGLTLRKGSDEYLGAYYPKRREGMEGLPAGRTAIVIPGRANTFAHEWGHALDYKLGEIFKNGKDNKAMSLVEYVKMLDRTGSKKLDQNSMDRAEQQRIQLARAMAEVYRAMMFQQDGKTFSDFFLNTANFAARNGDYWARATEMFARTFESYVSFNAERFGGGTEFLGLADRVYSDQSEGFIEKVYPNQPDRMRLYRALDDLMVAVTRNTDLSGPAALLPGNPTILPSAWARMVGPQMQNMTAKAKFTSEFEFVRSSMRGAAKAASAMANADKAEVVQSGRNAFNNIFASMRGALMSIQAKRQSPALQWVNDQLFPVPGQAKDVKRTYEEAREWQFKTFNNRLGRIIKSYGINNYDKNQLETLRELLVTGGRADTSFQGVTASKSMKEAAVMLRQLMDDMYYYATIDGKLDIGYTKNGYLPRILDDAAVLADGEKFMQKAAEVYGIQFEREIGADGQEIANLNMDSKRMDAWREAVRDAQREGLLTDEEIDAHREAMSALRSDDTQENRDALADAIDAIYDRVKEHAARMDAQAWHQAITTIGPANMHQDAPPSRFTKGRSLPPEADMLMKDFYFNNPIDLISRYAASVTRKVEFTKRFGANGAEFYKRLNAMRLDGVTEDEIQTIQKFFHRITGTDGMNAGIGMVWFNTLFVLSTIRLMVRSLWTNITEPLVVSLRTGNVVDAGRVVAGVSGDITDSVWRYFGGKGRSDVQFLRDMSEFSGIVADTMTEQIVQQHITDQQRSHEWVTRLAAGFYENIGLAGYTRVSRRVAMKIGMIELERSANRLLNGKDASKARLVFLEGGIPEAMHEEFARWYLEHFGNNRMTPITEIEGQALTPYLQTFLARWTDQSLQDPKRVDKPYYATDGIWRAPYGLLSFSYAFFNNVVKRSIRIAAGKGDLSGQERAKFIASTAGMMMLYIFVQTLAGIARTENYGDDEDKEKKRKALGKMMSGQWDADVMDLINEGVSRSGFFGPLDPLVQHTYQNLRGERAVRYDATLPKLILGPQIGSLFDDIARVGQVWTKMNSPNTTTSEFNAARGLYNLGVGYLSTAALGIAPLGPFGKIAAGNPFYGVPQLTTPKVRDRNIEAVTDMTKPQKPGQQKGLGSLQGAGPKSTLKGL